MHAGVRMLFLRSSSCSFRELAVWLCACVFSCVVLSMLSLSLFVSLVSLCFRAFVSLFLCLCVSVCLLRFCVFASPCLLVDAIGL